MSWRPSPFIVGQPYRVKKHFTSGNSTFIEGEILLYKQEYYSHYDSSAVYQFQKKELGESKEWWLHDNENLETWNDHFEWHQIAAHAKGCDLCKE